MLEARLIWFLRIGQLATAILFSFIVLGLSGNIISRDDGISPDFAGLSLATAVLTMVAIVPVMIIDFLRKGAFTSLVVTEIVWTSFLTILWLAAAADTTSILNGDTCSDPFFFDTLTTCREEQALAAFGWLNFFNLGGWLVFLIVAASISHTRGNDRVWLGPVTGTEFFAPAGKAEQSQDAVEYAPQQVPQGYSTQPMEQQYTGNTYLGPQQPVSYPPSNGYEAPAAPVPNQQFTYAGPGGTMA